MSLRVREISINPVISSDELLAALREIHDGGTGSIGALHKIGCCYKIYSETHVMLANESTAKPGAAAGPFTIPGIRIRRDAKERQMGFFPNNDELNHEYISLVS